MTVQALDAQADVHVVGELDWLGRRYLSLTDAPDSSSDQEETDQAQAKHNQRRFQEFGDQFAHANSSCLCQ